MDTENFVVNDGRQSQKIEDSTALSPHVGVPILRYAFVIEAIYLRTFHFPISTEGRNF